MKQIEVTSEKKSFLTSLPGILTGAAGLITAIVGLIIALNQVGIIGGSSTGTPAGQPLSSPATVTQTTSADTWAAEANQVCARANDAIDALPEADTLDLESAGETAQQVTAINRRMLRELTALERPAERKAEIAEFLRIGARLGEEGDAFFAAIRAGNLAAAQERTSELSRLGRLFDASATDLGATTCAEGASELGL
jgi:hypothetical protein